MTQRVDLREYARSEPIALTLTERDVLRRIAPTLNVVPVEGSTTRHYLTPAASVGTIRVGDLVLVIRPKVTIRRVLFLLSYSLDPRRWTTTAFNYDEEEDLFEAVVPGFVTHARTALRRGLLHGYRTREESLATVRGRIQFPAHIRRRYGLAPPIETVFDEFTDDIEENRLIKATVLRLRRLHVRSESARRSLRELEAVLTTVSDIAYDPRFLPDLNYNRLNEHYRPAVELAKLILRHTSFDLRHGSVAAAAFLVNMNHVFEDFVVVALREALGLSLRTFPRGREAGKRLHLDAAEHIPLEPDLSWWDGHTCTFVGDAKYKRLNAAGILHPDLYQLLAYTVAAGLPTGLLVYAAGEEVPQEHVVTAAAKVLRVRTLDLDCSPESVLGQVATLSQEICKLRRMQQAPSNRSFQ